MRNLIDLIDKLFGVKFVKHCLSIREQVVANEFYLLFVYVWNLYFLVSHFLNDSPMEESEAQINQVHASTSILLIVYSEHFGV